MQSFLQEQEPGSRLICKNALFQSSELLGILKLSLCSYSCWLDDTTHKLWYMIQSWYAQTHIMANVRLIIFELLCGKTKNIVRSKYFRCVLCMKNTIIYIQEYILYKNARGGIMYNMMGVIIIMLTCFLLVVVLLYYAHYYYKNKRHSAVVTIIVW